MIDNQVCGQVPNGCRNGQWYTVKCSRPLFGGKVRLVTTQNTYLHISGIEVWTAAPPMTRMRTTSTSRTRMIPG